MWGCNNLTIIVVFSLRIPFQYSGASMSAESVNLENRCNLMCYRASEQASVAPYSPHGGSRTIGGCSPMIITWFLVTEAL